MKSKAGLISGHARKGRLRPEGRLAAILVGLAALAAACGGPGIPGYVNGSPGSSLAFAVCMRAHGVPHFPDPTNGGWNSLAGINQHSPQFLRAAGACGATGPGIGSGSGQQAQGMAKALAFSRCMRAHGVRNYPDPTVSNGNFVDHYSSSGNGMDPLSPTFQAARRVCLSALTNAGKRGSTS